MKNKYEIKGKCTEILIHSKYGDFKTIVDTEDIEKIKSYKNMWCINYKNGRIDGVRQKIQKNKTRKQFWLHRIIMNCPEDMFIDHINGNTMDNRKENLRIVTQEENSTNLSSESTNTSGYRNIYCEKDGKYSVRIKNKRYGRYKSLEKAIKIRNGKMVTVYPLRKGRINMQKGVTLITLIITIIVVIILAAIAINNSMEIEYENGIINICPTCGREVI